MLTLVSSDLKAGGKIFVATSPVPSPPPGSWQLRVTSGSSCHTLHSQAQVLGTEVCLAPYFRGLCRKSTNWFSKPVHKYLATCYQARPRCWQSRGRGRDSPCIPCVTVLCDTVIASMNPGSCATLTYPGTVSVSLSFCTCQERSSYNPLRSLRRVRHAT